MRITCPNCTAHFEIPSELLGRKGRSLKCASCGHSWYQTPQVETIDLAEIMGEEYAAKAKADMGVGPNAAPPPNQQQPQQRPPQQPPQMRQAQPGAPMQQPGMPPPAVSLMGPRQGQPQPLGQPMMRPPGAPPPGMPGAQPNWNAPQQQQPQRGAAPPPGTPAWYNPAPGQGAPPPGAPGAPGWYTPQQGAAGAPPGAAGPAWYNPTPGVGAPPPGARPGQQQNPQMAGNNLQGGPSWQHIPSPRQAQQVPGPGGQQPLGAPTWFNPQAAAQGAAYAQQPQNVQAAAMQGRSATMGPGGPGVAAAALGQSMVTNAHMQAPGEGAVSWVQNPGQNLGMPPGAMPPGMAPGMMMQPNQRAAMAAQMGNQSMMGQAGAAAVGDQAVSWMQQNQPVPPAIPGMNAPSLMGQAGAAAVGQGSVSWMNQNQQMPGVPGQSMGQPGIPGAPGMPGVSQLSGQQVAAPGQGARSLIDGTTQAPGMAGQSMMGQAAQAPGLGAVSQLTGQHLQAPGDPARSMLDGSIQQGVAGQSMLHDPGAGGQPGQSMMHDAGAGGQLGQSMMHAPGVGGQATEPVQGSAGAEGTLVTDPAQAAADADIAGADGEKTDEEKAALFSNAKEDEELVDPNADRPDFGTGAAEEEAAAEDEENAEDEEGEAGDEDGKKPFPIKPSRSIDPAYITAALMVVATIAVGAGIYSQRAALSKSMPGLARIYEKMGMTPKNPGEGLRLAQSSMRLTRIGGVETLVVKGYISNIGKDARNVPGLRLQLVDGSNQVVQETTAPAPKANLEGGGSVDYEMRLELPDMAKAKNVIVAWQG